MRYLDALGTTGPYRARKRTTVPDVTGEELAELSLVPPVFVQHTLATMRAAQPHPPEERITALRRAAELFATSELDGRPLRDHEETVSRAGGIPVSVVRAASTALATRLSEVHHSVRNALPRGAVDDWLDPRTRRGSGVWARRGEVFTVHSAGNHPGTHSIWPEALALGYRVAVRPSRREPFTAHRLVTALRAAGFAEDQVTLLPTPQEQSEALVRGSDLSLVYGGDEVVRGYGNEPHVRTQGPGRSKILITAEQDWREHLDMIVDSVSGHGGTGCVNTTSIFVEGDPTGLASALAERLAAFPSLPPTDEKAVLPVQPLARARAIETHLTRTAEGAGSWLGGTGVAEDLGDGSAVLRPAVHQLDEPKDSRAGVELPFPCAWILPWDRDAGTTPLRDSLVLAAITTDERLVSRLLAEPSIGNVYVGGGHPTCLKEQGLPHDGYLAEFLMRSKSVIRH
ncbi:aldehyde dehydrogenase family protein [Actinopolyspora mortivallis]|uniref:aldehyde dehydrogenase family protein n=1 Tax=Actinopolyspora mortivallis TaxID=33906 RepID=UPI00036CA334|nr:aldehyde dehydrogenase family protein [Actinopolyspora mortivallis]